jgi:hypothetical protein
VCRLTSYTVARSLREAALLSCWDGELRLALSERCLALLRDEDLRVAGVTVDLPGQRYFLQLQQLPNCISQYQAGMSSGPRRVRRGSTPSPLGTPRGAHAGLRPSVSLLPSGSLVHSTEATRVAPNIGRNQYSSGIGAEEERRSGCQKPTPQFALPRQDRNGRGNWFQLLCPDGVGYAPLEVACIHFF